jgi:hypothetical protein
MEMLATSSVRSHYGRGVWVPAFAGTTSNVRLQLGLVYASPAVSNIAAFIASCADLPAQTTNWNAGK